MKIITPTEIENVAWEGTLAPLGEWSKVDKPDVRVTIGEPVWWTAEQALEGEINKKWTPPADNRQYLLLRLACTLHPPASQRTRYTEATFGAYLWGDVTSTISIMRESSIPCDLNKHRACHIRPQGTRPT
jgi:hypothetical protein